MSMFGPAGCWEPTVPFWANALSYHLFQLGQIVVSSSRAVPLGPYLIIRLLPVVVGNEPRYRVMSLADQHERELPEAQIRLFPKPPSCSEGGGAKR
jgi:hypothetical protein